MSKLIHKTAMVVFLAANVAYGKKPPQATAVRTITTKLESITDEYVAIGTLKASEGIEVTSSVTERITSINFVDGQRVEEGDILLKMDTAEEMALLEEERSRLDEANRQLKRLTPLVKSGAASASALDTSRREYETAKARMAAIESRINLRILRAPFSGVLGLRHVSVGAIVQPGSRITTLDADEFMNLDFAIPEPYIASLKLGTAIGAQGKALPGKILQGKIRGIDSRIDPQTRTILVRALIPNPEEKLKSGMLLEVKVKKNPRQAILLPEEAVLSNGSKHFIFVVNAAAPELNESAEKSDKNSAAQGLQVTKTEITLGRRSKGKVEVLSALEPGTRVVTHGLIKLKDGAQVTVNSQQPEA